MADGLQEELKHLLDSGEWEVDNITIPLKEIAPEDGFKKYERLGVAVIVLKVKEE